MQGQYKLIAIIGVLFVAVISANAQEDERVLPGLSFQPAHSYSMSDIESIDNAYGAISLHIPLAQLPPGPAGFTAGMMLVYNNKYWIKEPDETDVGIAVLKESEYGGWRLGTKPMLQPDFFQDLTCNLIDPVFQVKLTEPDGNRRMFYISYPAIQDTNCPDGTYYNSQFDKSQPSIWYTIDGSFLRLEIDSADESDSWPSNASWTVYRQDGSSVRFDSTTNITYLRDRNGNQIVVQGSADLNWTNPGTVSVMMSDQFGRSIQWNHIGGTNQDTVTQKSHRDAGDNDGDLTWYINLGTHDAIFPTEYICSESAVYCYIDQLQNRVVDSLVLPNGLSYTFSYNRPQGFSGSDYHELRTMTLPGGATVEYGYRLDDHGSRTNWWNILGNTVKSRTIRIGGQIVEQWTYKYWHDFEEPYSNRFALESDHSEHTAPDGGTTIYRYNSLSNRRSPRPMDGTITGIEYPDGSRLDREWVTNIPIQMPTPQTENANPWIRYEWSTVANSENSPVGTSTKVFEVDKNGNQTSVEEHRWVASIDYRPIPSAATLIRKTVRTYENQAVRWDQTGNDNGYSYSYGCPTCFTPPPGSATPRNLLKSSEVQNSSETKLSRSEYGYHEAGYARTIGNLTIERHWDSTKGSIVPGYPLDDGNSIKKTYTYTLRGNLSSETDARDKMKTYDYGPILCGSSNYTDLYRTGAHEGDNGLLNWAYQYYCYSGMQIAVTDPNSLITSTKYDRYSRPEDITEGSYSRTTHEYSDSLRRIITRKDVGTFNDPHNIFIKHYDELGRLRLSRQLESYIDDPANESAGIRTDYKYVFAANRNETWTSNPYRNSEAVAPTRGWTVKRHDKTGRLCVEEWFAGASNPSVATNCTPSSGTTGATVYSYNATVNHTLQTITDPAARSRNLYHDVLGRLIAVREDPGSAKYDTYYEYDLLDNLTLTRQVGSCSNPDPISSPCSGGQTRTFAYSSLKRLTAATNPESGNNSISYSYDNNGNLIQKVVSGSQGLTVNFGYDSINRVTTRDYSDGITPPVTYCYDGRVWSGSFGQCNGTPAIPSRQGLTEVGSTISRTSYGYNSWGNVITSTQTTAGQAYTFGYTYNAAASLASITYPSGRTITTEYDDAGRPKNLKGTMGAAEKYYVGNPNTAPNRIQYASHGGISSMLLGNGILESRAYNSRLQPTQIQAGSLVSLLNCYQTSDNADCSGLAVQGNNGNVQRQKIIRGQMPPWVQEYTYDVVNRLASATETGVWSRTYGYDAFGNRWVAGGSGLSPSGLTPVSQNWFDPATNRLVGTNNYDSRGNMVIYDGYTLSYDGDDRIISKSGATPSTKYEYDGEGRRVRAHSCSGTSICTPGSGASTTVFVYDAFGKLAVEHRPDAAATGTNYYTHDHLGSTRLETDSAGYTVQISDYLPFGEEIPSGTGNRPSYASAENKIKFTSKERDVETGLDYFFARYYSGAQGRFTSPDAVFADQHPEDPQSWNMYAYVRNNPLTNTDPTGRDCTNGIQECAEFFVGVGQSVVNIIPDTINLPNHLANALISPFTDFQFEDVVPRLEATTPDMQEGQIAGTAAMLVAGVGELAGGALGAGGAAAEVSTVSKGSEVAEVGTTAASKSFNPFKGKSTQEVGAMFEKKGFQARGPEPLGGKGGYVNPQTGRSYHIDPGGPYKKGSEVPHVDVNRPKSSDLHKRKFPL